MTKLGGVVDNLPGQKSQHPSNPKIPPYSKPTTGNKLNYPALKKPPIWGLNCFLRIRMGFGHHPKMSV